MSRAPTPWSRTRLLCLLAATSLAACGDTTNTRSALVEDASDGASGDIGDADTQADAPDVADAPETSAPVVPPPDQPGPYRAGAFDATWVDTGRDRTLPVTAWYPTGATEGDTLAYFDGLITVGGALANAPPARPGPWPVVVFSHGNQGFRAQSFFLTEYLATHGYVVVAADHVGNSADTFEIEEWVTATIERPRDVAAMIDAVTAWNADPEHPLFGLVDTERVGVVGHSFGGFTTFAAAGAAFDMLPIHAHCVELGEDGWRGEWAFCDRITASRLDEATACSPACALGDGRISVAVAMAPAFAEFFVTGGIESIPVPVLVMAGTLDDPWSPEYARRGYFDRLDHAESLLWVLDRASHYSFSDACSIDLLRALPLFGCNDTVIDPARGHALIRSAVTAFLGVHLGHEDTYRASLRAPGVCAEPEVTMFTPSGPEDCGG